MHKAYKLLLCYPEKNVAFPSLHTFKRVCVFVCVCLCLSMAYMYLNMSACAQRGQMYQIFWICNYWQL